MLDDGYYSNRKELRRSSSKASGRTIALGAAIVLKCVGVYLLADQLRQMHVVTLLCAVHTIAAFVVVPLQKPFADTSQAPAVNWLKVIQLAIFRISEQTFFYYGITLCGPLRSQLIYDVPAAVVVAATATVFRTAAPSAAKTRGTVFLGIGFLALIVLDRDITADEVHSETHAHHSGLNHLWHHATAFIGLSDHKGGVVLLLLALLMHTGYSRAFSRLSKEYGGAKRINAATHLCCAAVTLPLAIIVAMFGSAMPANANIAAYSFLTSLLQIVCIALFMHVCIFYAEQSASHHLDTNTTGKWAPVLSFIVTIVLAWLKYGIPKHHDPKLAEHVLSPGVIITVIMFSLATNILTSATIRKAHPYILDGWDMSGKPIFRLGEDILQRTTISVKEFAQTTMAHIWARQDSRRIFYFLCLNLAFCAVEFLYGIWTNSLGLVSDAFHMLFDCLSLVMGLIASVMTSWSASGQFTHGYGRVEVLSGFINGLFLCVIASAILMEAISRLFEPPEIHTDKLLFVSVAGLIVNLFGIMAFHSSHGHSHGGGSDHGHSHGGHGHSHGGSNANMYGVYLHILSDTGGSVAVIVSTLLIQHYGLLWVDPLCSLLLACLIIVSVLPLIKEAASVLLQSTPEGMLEEFEEALAEVLHVEGVTSYSDAHCWQLKSDVIIGSLHVQVLHESNAQQIAQRVQQILLAHGLTQAHVQVEAEAFFQRIHSLYPGYIPAERTSKPLMDNVMTNVM